MNGLRPLDGKASGFASRVKVWTTCPFTSMLIQRFGEDRIEKVKHGNIDLRNSTMANAPGAMRVQSKPISPPQQRMASEAGRTGVVIGDSDDKQPIIELLMPETAKDS